MAAKEVKQAEATLKGIFEAIADDWTIYDAGTRFSVNGFGVVDPEKSASLGQLNSTREAVARQILQLQSALQKNDGLPPPTPQPGDGETEVPVRQAMVRTVGCLPGEGGRGHNGGAGDAACHHQNRSMRTWTRQSGPT